MKRGTGMATGWGSCLTCGNKQPLHYRETRSASHSSASASQNVTINIMHTNLEDWQRCFSRMLKHSKGAKNWSIPRKASFFLKRNNSDESDNMPSNALELRSFHHSHSLFTKFYMENVPKRGKHTQISKRQYLHTSSSIVSYSI